jgi:hypothetical protein
MDIDMHELNRYVIELEKVPSRLDEELVKVGARGAFNIKRDWIAAWSGRSYISGLARAVTYERMTRVKELEWVIGPDKRRPQGALGNIIEYGSVKNAPIPGGAPALDKEAPRLEKAIADATEKVLGG